ncbi:MAG: hypothetical protein MR897_04760, partial [Bacteroidales bacterium]|nr:hypothetical protein [Bacteroidales bacterium]
QQLRIRFGKENTTYSIPNFGILSQFHQKNFGILPQFAKINFGILSRFSPKKFGKLKQKT